MTLTEKVSYLKGLFDGLEFNTEKKEGKLLSAMLDLLDEMALTISDLEDEVSVVSSEVEELFDEVSVLEEEFYGDEDFDDEDEEYDFEDDFEDDDEEIEILDDEDLYQILCPTCEEEIFIDEGTLELGAMKCPACGEDLEFDTSLLDEECGCGCGCSDDDCQDDEGDLVDCDE